MLVKMTVSNFLSFEQETELSMISSNKTRKLSSHKISIKDTTLLKHAVIYGANAAGKSNLVEVFTFINYCVRRAIPAQAATMFCRTKEENASKPSKFEIIFVENGKFYAYGFSLILQERKIDAEWLHELFQNGSSKILFERKKGDLPVIGDSLGLKAADQSKIDIYLDDFDQDSTLLFLTFMNRQKKYHSASKLKFFAHTYNWISENLDIYTPQTKLTNLEYYYNESSLTKINELIKTFDTGITEVNVQEIPLDEFKRDLPKEVYDDVMTELEARIEKENVEALEFSMRFGSFFFNLKTDKGKEVKVTTLKLTHGNSFYDFKFNDESDGTIRLFELLDILLNKTENKVFIIDEMERSLHPKLTSRFIELFHQMHENQNIQLIFTTHESSIMDQDLFRRDEIWFVERDIENRSCVYSLDVFKERYDKVLSKAYLEGRYGAIPVFSNFRFKEE